MELEQRSDDLLIVEKTGSNWTVELGGRICYEADDRHAAMQWALIKAFDDGMRIRLSGPMDRMWSDWHLEKPARAAS